MAQTLSSGNDAVSADNSADKEYLNQNLGKQYEIGTLEYPVGLRNLPDLQHYVAFFINVRDKSTLGKQNQDKDYFISVDSEEGKRLAILQAEENRLSQKGAETAVSTVAKNIGAITGAGVLLSSLGRSSGILDAIRKVPKGAAKGLIAGTGAQIISNEIQKENFYAFRSGSTSRLKEVITLHVEERPSVKYGVNYSTSDMAGFLGLGGIFVQGSVAKSTEGGLQAMAPEAKARVLAEIARIPSLGGQGFIPNLLELSSKTKTNPFRETLFESVDYRTFNFRYRFFPKSWGESQRVKRIIDMFKIHMYPELTPDKMFYVYPSEFDIQYYFKNKENNYLHKFTKCALTDLAIDYGGEQFVTFQDGAPAEISVSLTFTELEQLSSQKVRNGY